jgi:hypothetical protein
MTRATERTRTWEHFQLFEGLSIRQRIMFRFPPGEEFLSPLHHLHLYLSPLNLLFNGQREKHFRQATVAEA